MNAMRNLLRLLSLLNLLNLLSRPNLLSAARLKADSFERRLTNYFFNAAQRDIAKGWNASSPLTVPFSL